MQLLLIGLLLVLVLNYSASIWIKKYMENYHRPTYYNKRHSSKDHVDYNREALEKRDKDGKNGTGIRPPFDPEKDLSYYVHVLHLGSVICPGALISYRMVITSSNCFQPKSEDERTSLVYRASEMGVTTGGQFAMSNPHQVIAFFMPVDKVKEKISSVALLGLQSKLSRNSYRHIDLYQKKTNAGDQIKIAFLDPQSYRIEHSTDSKILKKDRCQSYHTVIERFGTIPGFSTEGSDYFCTASKKNPTTCSTRPGDPLLVDNKLAGINVFGAVCSNSPIDVNIDIYMPIRPVVKFIQMATDALRAFTHTGPYNTSNPFPSPLVESLITRQPNFFVGETLNFTDI
ncbi:uncharacterized protein aqrs [Drosophila kikkawai]|uniref:Uncharacterized protein aqrs n=1 Tax=Drosophila kikkawai TaxID=30033 RepID=A0A6P4IS90_DROKI|nr:uncharacterized protein LOC108080962 [Drosophila kikkawai]